MSDDSQTHQDLAEALFAIAAAGERVAEQLRAANLIALADPKEQSDGSRVSSPIFVPTEHRGSRAWRLRSDLKKLLKVEEPGDV